MECADKIAKDDKIFVYQDENSFLIDSDKAYFGGVKDVDAVRHLPSYIDGYIAAAKSVFDGFTTAGKTGNIGIQDTIIYPLVFLHRHCLELQLKLIYSIVNANDFKAHKKNHSLLSVWKQISDDVLKAVERVGKHVDIDAITHYMDEFTKVDSGSFNYRYPYANDFTSTLPELRLLDVPNFHDSANRCHHYLKNITYILQNQVSSLNRDKTFERQFKYVFKQCYEKIEGALNYSYPSNNTTKRWLRPSEIAINSEAEIERELQFIATIPEDVQEIVLILYYGSEDLDGSCIAMSGKERFNDILKVLANTYSNPNVFSKENMPRIFVDKFNAIVRHKEQILKLANTLNEFIQAEA